MAAKKVNPEETNVMVGETEEFNSQASTDEKPRRSENSIKTGKVVNTKYATLRRMPSANAQAVASLRFGDKAEIIEEITGFYKIKTSKGLIGYISSNYFKEE